MRFMRYSVLFALLVSPSVQFAQQKELAVKLSFSHTRGIYRDPFQLTISSDPPGKPVLYTWDGTDPTRSSSTHKAAAPVVLFIDPADTAEHDLAPMVCVRAAAVENGRAVSQTETHSYLFVERIVELSPDGKRPGPQWPPQRFSGDQQFINYGLDPDVCNHRLYRNQIIPAFLSIPSISIVMDPADLFDPQKGIYMNAYNHGKTWERPCSIELIHPDEREGFQINAGIRIRGGYSRSNQNPKHAFRFFFRKEYGAGKLKYPLFDDEGVDEFDAVDLRTSQNYSWAFDGSDLNTMNRDVFSRDAQRDMGQPYTRSRYYHLYLNGTYWGLYQTQERSEASFGASYFGGAPEDYDVIKIAADQGYVIEATDGTLDAWRSLWETAKNGFLSDSAYYLIQGKNADGSDNPDLPVLLDVDNLIDYMLVTFYTGNLDAPISHFCNNTCANNFYALYNRKDRRGFIFFQHDSEHCLLNVNEDRTGPFAAGSTFDKFNPQYLHQRLMEHPLYRARFADHVFRHFFGDGALTPHRCTERFLARKKEINLAIIAESARWGDSKRSLPFTRDNAWLPTINRIVNDFFPKRTHVVLEQFKAKGWFPSVTPPHFNAEGGRIVKGFPLQISAPAGAVYYTTDGSDPYAPGIALAEFHTLFSADAEKFVHVPEQKTDFQWRRPVSMDFSSWIRGIGGVGYERDNGYQPFIRIDVGSRMYNKQTSCYIRIPFKVKKAEFKDYNILQLKVMYDDGFAAYLNGWRCADALAPENLVWNAQASGSHESGGWEVFDISSYMNRLVEGDNFLAVHALNVSTTSSDFLFSAELVIGKAVSKDAMSPTAQQYKQPIVLNETTTIKARALAEQWSPLIEATFYVLVGLENLRVTEIHYHPLPSHPDADDDEQFEFIELKNTGDEELDLGDCFFSRGITFRFGQGTRLAPKAFIVLAADSSGFFARYGFKPHGQYVGRLDNRGETISFNSPQDTLFAIRYGDRWPWPRSTDGGGYSLTSKFLSPWIDQNDAGAWTASGVIHGTPCRDDLTAAPVLRTVDQSISSFRLLANYPNPFNAQTAIPFEMPRTAWVKIHVFNLLGQRVAVPVDAVLEAGRHTVIWNSADAPSGVYFYRMTAEDFCETRKFTLMR